ncbi:MAG: hypothetical protein LBV72_10760 [Tannerella sp.]|jgi:hypothetical protein|nr:hypothetical protein [Tannerella sp.]
MKLLLFCIGLLALSGYEQEPAAKVNAGNNTVSEIVMDNAVIDNMNRDILSGELPGNIKPTLVGDTLVSSKVYSELNASQNKTTQMKRNSSDLQRKTVQNLALFSLPDLILFFP